MFLYLVMWINDIWLSSPLSVAMFEHIHFIYTEHIFGHTRTVANSKYWFNLTLKGNTSEEEIQVYMVMHQSILFTWKIWGFFSAQTNQQSINLDLQNRGRASFHLMEIKYICIKAPVHQKQTIAEEAVFKIFRSVCPRNVNTT